MWEFLKRLFNIGKVEVQAKFEKKQDPAKVLTELVGDLKGDLSESMRGLAEVKTLSMRMRYEVGQSEGAAKQYQEKAMLFLEKAAKGELPEADADRYAAQALAQQARLIKSAKAGKANLKKHEQLVDNLESNIQALKAQITDYESELRSLKARTRVSEASKRIYERLSQVDRNSPRELIAQMREQVDQNEALAASYSEVSRIAHSNEIDDEVDRILNSQPSEDEVPTLASLKQQVRLGEGKKDKPE
ncbi:MAG: PspA/IM30 family protein [Bernardetiaceae bacterium]|nr:PspA/IM30 family protein [Bernardetiaceae bacterium]